MVYIGNISVAREKHVSFLAVWNVLQKYIEPWTTASFSFPYPHWTLSSCSVNYCERSVKSHQWWFYICLFLPSFHRFSFHTFWGSVFRYIHIVIPMSSWKTDHFIIVKCSSLSLVTIIVFKYTLSGAKLATSAVLYLLHGISVSIILLSTYFFIFKISLKQPIVSLIFHLVYLDNVCILIWIFGSFILNINTDMVRFTS